MSRNKTATGKGAKKDNKRIEELIEDISHLMRSLAENGEEEGIRVLEALQTLFHCLADLSGANLHLDDEEADEDEEEIVEVGNIEAVDGIVDEDEADEEEEDDDDSETLSAVPDKLTDAQWQKFFKARGIDVTVYALPTKAKKRVAALETLANAFSGIIQIAEKDCQVKSGKLSALNKLQDMVEDDDFERKKKESDLSYAWRLAEQYNKKLGSIN